MVLLRWVMGMSLGVLLASAGSPPQFYLIEPFNKKAVLLHFDTEANRRYELQFSTNALTSPPGTWTNLYVVPAIPFADHFVFYHELTNGPVGFFRLTATP